MKRIHVSCYLNAEIVNGVNASCYLDEDCFKRVNISYFLGGEILKIGKCFILPR